MNGNGTGSMEVKVTLFLLDQFVSPNIGVLD